MAVAVGTMVHDRRGQVTELEGFLVPKILRVNLKKKSEDHSMNYVGNDIVTEEENGGSVNRIDDSSNIIENVQKNLSKIRHDESSIEVRLGSIGDDEELTEMAPERHQSKGNEKQSSYLLQPFLKPVAEQVEGGAADNPILKALFGGGNSSAKSSFGWVTIGKASLNNCHPFKKTGLSRDILNDSTPVCIPKSLSKDGKTNGSPQLRNNGNRKSQLVNRALKENRTCPVNDATTTPQPVVAAEKTITPTKQEKSQEKENRPVTPENILRRNSSTQSKISQSKGRTNSVSSIKKIGYVNSERLMKLRMLVDNAIKNHRVYSMTGCYNSIRNALKQRGWIEKIDSDIKGKKRQNKFEDIGIYDAAFNFVQKFPTLAAMRYSIQTQSGFSHNDDINYSGQGEAEIINRMLRNINEDLCWLSRPYPYYCWKDMGKFDLVNRLPKAYFSNKIGLCNSLQQIQWYFEPGVCSTQYPRTYNMSQKDEYQAFKDDFRMTACIGLLKWLTNTYKCQGEKAVRSIDGKVDSCVVDFALKRCTEYVKYREHEDIDLPEGSTVWEYQWDHFITQYYKIINEGHVLKECKSDPSIQIYVTNALSMLNIIKAYWPQINIDGYQNFWVVKPGGRCCGNGIVIKNNLEQILSLVNPTVTRETRYVVQKYIEKPLLIYNTKFDIRQWFLVTSVYPLTVWMYRESYLRFCSQPFSLKNTHESIHLCNNAVQRRYKNSKRDRGLPDENMWDCYTFQTYLKSIGQPDAWEKYIYPGMKEGFVGALLASQDTMERRKNCFELYGADFMISETLTDGPWLIEINSNPAMDSSTSVTARMCPQVLEDIVKVVIDRRDDKNAPTGAFEMVFKQHCPPMPPYLGMSLSIKGQKLNRTNSGETKPSSKKSKSPNYCGKFLQSETEDSQSEDPNEARTECRQEEDETDNQDSNPVKPAISSDMLEWLKKEILRAQFAFRLMNKEKENITRRASDLSIHQEMFKAVEGEEADKQAIRRCNSETLTIAQHSGEEIKNSEESCNGDSDGIDLPRILADVKEGLCRADEVTSDVVTGKRNLPRISESGESSLEKVNNGESENRILDMESAIQNMDEECSMNQMTVQTSSKQNEPEDIYEIQCIHQNETIFGGESTATMPITVKDEDTEPSDTGNYIVKQQEKQVSRASSVEKSKRNTNEKYFNRKRNVNRKTKIDYVKKNIEDVKIMQERPRSSRILQQKPRVNITPVPKNVHITDPTDFQNCYREELLNILHSMSSGKFVSQLIATSPKYWNVPFQGKDALQKIKTGPDAVGINIFKFSNTGSRTRTFTNFTRQDSERLKKNNEDENSESEKVEIPPVCDEISKDLNLNVRSPMMGGMRNSEANLAEERFSCVPSFHNGSGKDFNERFLGCLNSTTGERKLLAERSITNLVETGRRGSDEILKKLRQFHDSNSKVRLRQALKKGKDVEKTVAGGYQVYRAAKGFAKVGRKHLGKSHAEDSSARSNSIEQILDVDGKGSKSFSSPKSNSGLAISMENGAVRKVDRKLPKIQQWAFLDGRGLAFH